MVGKRLPESIPDVGPCLKHDSGVHVADPSSPEHCTYCDAWMGTGEEDEDPQAFWCDTCQKVHYHDDEGSMLADVLGEFPCSVCAGVQEPDSFDYSQLDPGIRETVKFLRTHGVYTSDSGDGKTKFETGQDCCALEFPHVFAVTEPKRMVDEARRIAALLVAHGIYVQPVGYCMLGQDEAAATDEDVTWDVSEAAEIETSYDPMSDVATIMIARINDTILAKHLVSQPHAPQTADN